MVDNEENQKNGNNDVVVNNDVPPEVANILDELPDSTPGAVKERIVQFMSSSFSARSTNPFIEKMNEKHLDKLIEQKGLDSDRYYKLEMADKKLFVFGIIAFIIILIFLTISLAKDNPSLYSDIFKITLTALISGFGGYGYGKSKTNTWE